MTVEKINITDTTDASVVRGGSLGDTVDPHGYYTFTCIGPDGNVKWEDDIDNLVTTVGKNALLDVFFGTGVQGAGKTTWYMGLANSAPTVAAGDTMASHSGWEEKTGYSQSTRPAITFSAASSGSKATASVVAFSINATATIGGAFVANNNTKSETSSTLYSVGAFTVGDKIVTSGDTINVTYTASA